MDETEFSQAIGRVSDFIVKYMKNISKEQVLSNVKPGYLGDLIEEKCSEAGTSFERIFQEFHDKILPGIVHWSSPHFHAYFPAGFSYASLISELLIAGLNTVDVNWEACPASVELEHIVLNWLARMMALPKEFLSTPESPGGGCIQTTSGEVTLLSLVAARKRILKRLTLQHPDIPEQEIKSRLIAYGSDQAHFSVERAGLIAGVLMRALPTDENGTVRGDHLHLQIENDLNDGLFPFYLVATLGTTTICSFDNVQELGEVCKAHGIWMHVDAAYAGAALVCPEYRYIAHGLEHAESFAVGLHKWMYMSYDVVAYWLKNRNYLEDSLSVDVIYLKHKEMNKTKDFINMQIGTGRKFRSLKVWMVLKTYGLEGIQSMIRRHVYLGKYMEELIKRDERFEVVTSQFGMVTFRLCLGNKATERLRGRINDQKQIMLTPCKFAGMYMIRFVVNYSTKLEDLEFAWTQITKCANELEEKNLYKL